LKNKIAIYGAGGLGREIAAMIQQINSVKEIGELIGFFDDGVQSGETVDDLPVLGGIDELNSYNDNLQVCLAIAAPQIRSGIVNKITNSRVEFPVITHPSAILGDLKWNNFGRGTIITAGVIITTSVSVGEFGILNLASTIGHDVTIGRCCTLMPSCSISGNVAIGDNTVIGTGSRIIQGVSIGEGCLVGAGAVVTKSFGSNLKLLGVPARKRLNHVEGV
jgi:sugar O-acyltransferase (sialic acid O-acetyltransferase NeuD family)